MIEAQHEGRTLEFRESERGGRAASADDHENGCISMSLTGTSPQGEEDTLDVCRILVRTMNRMGETWNEPVEGVDDTGCVAANAKAVLNNNMYNVTHRCTSIQVRGKSV
jgi:hypothetical protein